MNSTFAEADGTRRNERDQVSSDTEVSEPTTKVQYLPGVEHSSRLAGQENIFAVIIFIGSLAWMGFSIYSIAREANAPIKKSRRRREVLPERRRDSSYDDAARDGRVDPAAS